MAYIIGQTIARYKIMEKVGEGGMGAVYKAFDTLLDRVVAVKVLPPELAGDEEFVQRFIQEAKAAARLKHPNIVIIYDVGVQGDKYYIVMEFLEGKTLHNIIASRGVLPFDEVVNITSQLADALDYAHSKGLVHRDVKPSNVMVRADGHVTLMDFGIVKAVRGLKITRTGAAIGTPEYMAPEQIEGINIDHRADIYSLGVVVYEMLTGRPPFKADTYHAILHSHLYLPPPLPSQFNPAIAGEVEEVLLKAIAKRPEERFQTARGFALALQKASRKIAPSLKKTLKLITFEGQEYALKGDVITIGRESSNHIVINHPQVSRKHARIFLQGGDYFIMDMQSTNGTFLNARRLQPYQAYPIRPGDRIGLGPNVFLTVQTGAVMKAPGKKPTPVSRPRVTRRPDRKGKRGFLLLTTVAAGMMLFMVFAFLAAIILTSPERKSATPTAVAINIEQSVQLATFKEDFNNPSEEWEETDAENTAMWLEDGRYHILIKSSNMFAWRDIDAHFADFSAEVESYFLESPADGYCGLLFRYLDSDNFYQFTISKNGYYALYKWVDNSMIPIIEQTGSEYINPTKNLIKVTAIGDRISLYVNDYLLEIATDGTFSQGRMALLAGSYDEAGTHVAFDNLVVRPK